MTFSAVVVNISFNGQADLSTTNDGTYPVILEYQPPNTFRSIGQQDTSG